MDSRLVILAGGLPIKIDNALVGGIGVGYSASYPWQTVFNTFGALSIATTLFGLPYALALRIGTNIFGAAYTVLCNKLWDHFHTRTTISATPRY